jgi:hypothetical protein
MPDRVLRYVITGEDRGAKKTLEDTATAGEKAASKIGGAFSKLGGMVGGELGEALDKLSGAMDVLGEHGDSAAKKLTAFGAAGVGLGVTLTMIGANEKRATDQLRQSIEDTGHSFSDYSDQIEETVKHQENFGHTAEDTKFALQKLTQATQDPQKALEEMGVTADLAAARHVSLSDAAQLVARVLGGTGGKVLAQYGITMGKNADGTKNVDGALQQLADRLKGQAAAAVDNFSGRIDVVLTRLRDWGAEVGQKLGPAITVASGIVTAAGVVMQTYQARAAAAAAANETLAASEGQVATGATTMGAGLGAGGLLASVGRVLGPIGLLAGGTLALKSALHAAGLEAPPLGVNINDLAKATDSGSSGAEDLATAMENQLTPAMGKFHSATGPAIDDIIRATLTSKPLTGLLDSTGQSLDDVTRALQSSPDGWNKFIDGVEKSMKAGGANKDVIKFQVGVLNDLHTAWVNAGTASETSSQQINNATDILKAHNLTWATAEKQYEDAYKAAHTLDAELGYMSKALDTLSNNKANAALGALQLADAWDTATSSGSALTKQVQDHGTALKGNTADTRSNQEWIIQQILAINSQAIAVGKATGSVKTGTDSLGTNTKSLLDNATQAGYTRDQVQTLIDKYGATPKSVTTSIEQQGAEAVQQKLGDILTVLQDIAKPGWQAVVNFLAGNTSMPLGGTPGGGATGGLINGVGTGTSDSNLMRVSAGEYIVNAAATSKFLPMLNAINAPGMAAGGLVGDLSVNAMPGGINLSGFAQMILNANQKAANQMLASIGGAGGPATVGGDLAAWIAAAIAITGDDPMIAGAVYRRIMFESGGNPRAINLWDSNALAGDPSRGLMQTIGATFNAYHQPGTSNDIYDPVANIAAALNYIRARYGSIYLIDPPVQGYRNGAWNVNRDGLAFLHQRELVMDAGNADKFRAGAGGGVFIAPGAVTVYAAPGMDERRVAAEAFTLLRRWVDDRERRALKGPRR